jgi:hypothetical protein
MMPLCENTRSTGAELASTQNTRANKRPRSDNSFIIDCDKGFVSRDVVLGLGLGLEG